MSITEEIREQEQNLRAELVELMKKKLPDSEKEFQKLYLNTSYQAFKIAEKIRHFQTSEGLSCAERFSNFIYRIFNLNQDPLNKEILLHECASVRFLENQAIINDEETTLLVKYRGNDILVWSDNLAGNCTDEMHISDMALLVEILFILDNKNLISK